MTGLQTRRVLEQIRKRREQFSGALHGAPQRRSLHGDEGQGVRIAVLYTTYLDLPTNPWYNSWIAPFNPGPYGPSTNSEIARRMKGCASEGFYFEVSPTQGISDAMTAPFQKAVLQARLTK